MNMDNFLDWIQKPKVAIALISVLAVLVATGVVIGTYVSVRNEGRSQELAMNAQWNRMQINYGQFRTGFFDKLAIAREKRDAMDKILVDAVSGRYDKAGQEGTVDSKAVFSAIAEAYPDIKGLNIFDELIKDIQAGRERFAKDQEQMQDRVRSYNDWRTTGSFLHPAFVRWAGFPSSMLEVKVNGKEYHGQAALDIMARPIVGADTNQIFDSGVDQPVTGK